MAQANLRQAGDQNPDWAAFRSRLDETADYLIYILPLEKSHLIAVKLA